MELMIIFAIILIILCGPIIIMLGFVNDIFEIISEIDGKALLIILLVIVAAIVVINICIAVAEFAIDICDSWGYVLIILYVFSTIYSILLGGINGTFDGPAEWLIPAMPIVSLLLSAALLFIIDNYCFHEFINFLILVIPVTFHSIVVIIVSLINGDPISIITAFQNAI